MVEERIYKRHQAFNIAYEEIGDKIDGPGADFQVPLKYHHAPDKLGKFRNYVGYVRWFNVLYDIGQKLISQLEIINKNINNQKPSWYNRKKPINNIFDELSKHDNDLNDFKADVYEFQRCILATGISGNHDYAEAIYDQTRYLDIIESKIIATGERKISEMNNIRIQLLGLILSLTAIGVSIFSVYLGFTN